MNISLMVEIIPLRRDIFKDVFMARLILIRHGETDYNLHRRYCGFSNPPLNDKGRQQAKILATKLEGVRIDKIYSSDLKRASETAQIIFRNSPIEKVADFREVNFGLFEGLKYEQIIEKYPKLYGNWIDILPKIKIPKGEGLKDLSKRVKKRLFSILSRHKDKTIALITHGGPIRVILCDALKKDLKAFWQIEQESAALNIIEYSQESSPVIVKMNDVSHLSTKEEVTL